jgi:hypothetical protein
MAASENPIAVQGTGQGAPAGWGLREWEVEFGKGVGLPRSPQWQGGCGTQVERLSANAIRLSVWNPL